MQNNNPEKDFYNQGGENPFVVTDEIQAVTTEVPKDSPAAPKPAKSRPSKTTGQTSSSITWSVQEKYGRKMSTTWYTVWALVLIALLVGALILHLVFNYWQFWTSLVLGIIVFISILVLNRQRQSVTDYSLNESEVTINNHTLPLNNFRAFRLNQRDGQPLVELIPVKRFSAEVPLTLPNDKADEVLSFLDARLVIEQNNTSLIDRWLHKLGL